jgi:hypothetical protein
MTEEIFRISAQYIPVFRKDGMRNTNTEAGRLRQLCSHGFASRIFASAAEVQPISATELFVIEGKGMFRAKKTAITINFNNFNRLAIHHFLLSGGLRQP